MADTRFTGPASDLSPASLAERYCVNSALARRLLETEAHSISLHQGQTLFRQGEPGDRMYLLLRGRLAVRLAHRDGSETLLSHLEPGAVVGEMALLTGQPRTATVTAVTDAELMGCSRGSFERLAQKHPDELADFTHAVTRRMQEVQLAGVLGNLFGGLDAEAASWLQGELEWAHLGHGEVLFREGDPGEAMYILVSGRLRVTRTEPHGTQQVVGEVAPGEPVGELGLLSGEHRSATVVSIRETNVVRLTENVFARLAERRPGAVMRLTRLIIKRQQRSMGALPMAPVRALSLAVVPAGDDAPLLDFANDLAGHLEKHGSVRTLDGDSLDELLDRPGACQEECDHPAGLVVSAWLSEQETRLQYVLYVADREWSPWTERCASQADRLLIVADSRSKPDLGAVEQAIRERNVPARQELVLLHPKSAGRPSGTADWITRRTLHAHHHVRVGDEAHMRRLARRLTGRAVGLVLSGGGARGFAHVGVVRALEERGLEIDLVGGTSIGALLGGLYAMGSSPRNIMVVAARLANRKRMFDYTLPLAALMTSQKLTQITQEMYGDVQIEDLWRTCFCVSADLTRAERVIHRSGPLWKAVRASVAIPGLWTPIIEGENILVDGGALSNFPVDVMARLCEGGQVIGSNLTGRPVVSGHYEFGPSVSGWRILWSRLNPFGSAIRIPSLAATVWRAHELTGASEARQSHAWADLVIEPAVDSFSAMDYEANEAIAEIGYQAAREQLTAWAGAD